MVAEGEDQSAGPIIRTPDQRLRVFISSTLQELAAERAAGPRRHHRSCAWCRFSSSWERAPIRPADLYRAYLAQSHIFVGIYWQHYGWVAT